MLKQTMLMYTTTNHVNNNSVQKGQNPTSKPVLSSQPSKLASAPLGRGAYGLTFEAKSNPFDDPKFINTIKAKVRNLIKVGDYDLACICLAKIPDNHVDQEIRDLIGQAGSRSSSEDIRDAAAVIKGNGKKKKRK